MRPMLKVVMQDDSDFMEVIRKYSVRLCHRRDKDSGTPGQETRQYVRMCSEYG
jgi:hypothetical protein